MAPDKVVVKEWFDYNATDLLDTDKCRSSWRKSEDIHSRYIASARSTRDSDR